MIVDNSRRRGERDGENGRQVSGERRKYFGGNLPGIFGTCPAGFLHSLPSVYLFYICFLWENQ